MSDWNYYHLATMLAIRKKGRYFGTIKKLRGKFRFTPVGGKPGKAYADLDALKLEIENPKA